MQNTNGKIDTASAVETAGIAGSETLSGTPLILERLLQNCSHRTHERDTFAHAGQDEANGQRLVRVLREAYALVEDGHVHVGLIYPESRSFIEPLLSLAEELAVVYEFGAAWVYAGAPGSTPTITSRGDSTDWDFVKEHPSKIRQVSVYALQNGRLQKLCTKPARVILRPGGAHLSKHGSRGPAADSMPAAGPHRDRPAQNPGGADGKKAPVISSIMKKIPAPKISLPYIATKHAELDVKNGHAQLTVLGSPEIMENIICGLRSFELVLRSPDEVEIHCLYTKGFPAYEFHCHTSGVGATFGAHVTTLSIWQKDMTGRVKKLCEHPAKVFVPSPAAWSIAAGTPAAQPVWPTPIHHINDSDEAWETISIGNRLAAIHTSNFWDSQMAQAGKFAVSTHAGTVRVLVPDNLQHQLADMLHGVSWIEVKALPLAEWPEDGCCTQWLFEDFTTSPYLLALSRGAFLDAIPKQGEGFTIAFWTRREGQPHRHAELPGHWVTMPVLPQLDCVR